MLSKTVLITGEDGFLGAILLKNLAHEFRTVGFSGDITNREYCFHRFKEIQPDVVIHLAALSLPKQCADDPVSARSINIAGTDNIAAAANSLAKKIHFVFASTVQIYDHKVLSLGKPVDEFCAVLPQNEYAQTKYEAENILQKPEFLQNIKVSILRLFNHVHKSQMSGTFMSSIFIQIQQLLAQSKSSGNVIVGDLNLLRELNPVQSLTLVFKAICASPLDYKYEVFNVCSGKSRKLESVAHAFSEYFNMNLNFVTEPHLTRTNDAKVVVGSNEKIKKYFSLDYPQYTDLELVKYFCSDLE